MRKEEKNITNLEKKSEIITVRGYPVEAEFKDGEGKVEVGDEVFYISELIIDKMFDKQVKGEVIKALDPTNKKFKSYGSEDWLELADFFKNRENAEKEFEKTKKEDKQDKEKKELKNGPEGKSSQKEGADLSGEMEPIEKQSAGKDKLLSQDNGKEEDKIQPENLTQEDQELIILLSDKLSIDELGKNVKNLEKELEEAQKNPQDGRSLEDIKQDLKIANKALERKQEFEKEWSFSENEKRFLEIYVKFTRKYFEDLEKNYDNYTLERKEKILKDEKEEFWERIIFDEIRKDGDISKEKIEEAVEYIKDIFNKNIK